MAYTKIKRRKKRRQNFRKFCFLFFWILLAFALILGAFGIYRALKPAAGAKADVQLTIPTEHTQDEVLLQLQEMAKDDPDVAAICKDPSRYPQPLLAALANNPEMSGFVKDYPGDGSAPKGLSLAERMEKAPLLLQWDERWGYLSYGEDCIGLSGCGPTALSMACFSLTKDDSLTPDAIASYAMKNGYYVEGSGTAWSLMEDFPRHCGLSVAEVGASREEMQNALDGGAVIICAMGPGDFTTQGHFIVIYDYNADGFFVNDPNSRARSALTWDFDDIRFQMRKIWALKNG